MRTERIYDELMELTTPTARLASEVAIAVAVPARWPHIARLLRPIQPKHDRRIGDTVGQTRCLQVDVQAAVLHLDAEGAVVGCRLRGNGRRSARVLNR